MTYLKSAGRWRYLAVVLDRHSRRVLGWTLGLRKDPNLTLEALSRALSGRRVRRGLIFHSDRGVEYAAYAYRTRLAALGIVQSMRRRRRLNDNAFMESFFHSMKAEAIDASSMTIRSCTPSSANISADTIEPVYIPLWDIVPL